MSSHAKYSMQLGTSFDAIKVWALFLCTFFGGVSNRKKGRSGVASC
jgi:hypothetical protein